MMRYTLVSTPLGWTAVGMTERGVRAVTLPAQDRSVAIERLQRIAGSSATPISSDEAASLEGPLRTLLDGDRDGAGLPLDPAGTTFQRSVWEAIAAIPRGETRSYQWIAERIGRPRAARAVGQAVGANPLPMVVPCHRVITASGRVGGFAGGAELKRALLAEEGVALPN